MAAMPARELEENANQTEAAPEAQTDVAAEREAAQEVKTAAPEMPAIAPIEVATTAVTASTLAYEAMPAPTQAAVDPNAYLDHGVHHWEKYKASCEAAGMPEKWQDHYRAGHTDAQGWVNPWEQAPFENRNARHYEWELQPRTSASNALQAWLTGLTISDYRALAVAQELDKFRTELGDNKFDELFGSSDDMQDKKIPPAQRLKISAAAYGTPLVDQLRQLAYEDERNRAAPPKTPVVEAATEEKPKPAVAEEEVVPMAPDLEQAPAPELA